MLMFLFIPCQVGAEKTLKSEIRRLEPTFRASFSRPGFVTFKAPDQEENVGESIAELAERSVFARTASLSLGKVQNADASALVGDIWTVVEQNRYFVNRVHVFRRDPEEPGQHGFEPGATPELVELHRSLIATAPKPKFLGPNVSDFHHPALVGETVLDVIQVDPDIYFVGVHVVVEDASIQAFYPGGVMPITLPPEAVSRAWLKFEEGLRWSGLPIERGSRCVDIGAAPGGASQALLMRGAEVLGVDPAEIDPKVLENPRFTHVRGKINQTKRSLYRDVRWLVADMNVAPGYTMDVLEELVARKDSKIRGMLFTLKLFQWELADDLPLCADWIRRWGFDEVRIKQLAFNRQEVMLAAMKGRKGG